jgi:hypothetical protein
LKVAIRGVIACVLLVASVAVVGLFSAGDAGSKGMPANNVLANAVAVELGRTKADLKSPYARVSSGAVNAALERMGVFQKRLAKSKTRFRHANHNDGAYAVWRNSKGCPNTFHGRVANIRVNQDCGLRRQAEEWIGVNPRDFDNLTAGQNDSMVGFNHCGYDFSFDRGKSWASVGTSPPPFYQELFLTGDTADACSDPAGTFDHLGNAYVTGVFFEVADVESSIWVAKSNWPNGGAFYHNPSPTRGPAADPWQEYRTDVMGEPASDNDPDIFHDKELMVADSRSTSPKKGRVYVTWTRFETTNFPTPNFGRSPIVFSQSLDGGATWSRQVIISGAAGAFCTGFSGTPDSPNACDQDQGSHPVVGPDGTIYVIFGNGNTPEAGINQVMMVKCTPDKNCDSEADWTPPVRIGDLIGTHPFDPPDAVPFDPETGCPNGRQCLPPNGYRVPEFTSMSISVDRHSNLYAIWADHRDGRAPCDFRPIQTADPPCDHEVLYSFSTDRGVTWSPTFKVTERFGATAQWQPWHDVAGDGSKVYAAFYDRHYGNCEFSGCNDITLATISKPRSGSPRLTFKRITTASMPNLVPANNPVQAGFLGDYMWVEVSHHNFNQKDVHIVWADTRPLPYRLSHQRFPEEDIYYARIGDGDDDDDDDD